jgi:hypothetical protein
MVNSLSIFMTGTAPGRRSAQQRAFRRPGDEAKSAFRHPNAKTTFDESAIQYIDGQGSGVSPFPNSDCRDSQKMVGTDLGAAHGCRGPGAGPRRVRVGRPALPGSRAGTRARGKNSCDVVAASSGTSPDMAADCRNQPPHRPPL